MALTVNQAMLHGISLIKGPSTYASSEELRMANSVQSIISGYYRWHWLQAAATDIAVSAADQDITMAAGDQNTVYAIASAFLVEGSTPQPPLIVQSDNPLPATTTQGQPFGCGLISPTVIRLFPAADATYTFRWRKYARPVVFAANSENFQIPDAFTDVAKAGMIWQVLNYADDDRAESWKNTFYELLKNHKLIEMQTTGRMRG